jgi:ATPase subunit of ABC transporter with duplicated ATPase domains
MRKELAWLRRGAPARTSKPKFRIDAANALIADVPPPRNTVELSRMATARLGKDVVDIEDVSVAYGDHEVLHRVTWLVGPGERTGILGVNGAGKSTLLGLVTGEVTATSGRVKRGKTVKVATLTQELAELADIADDRVSDVIGRYRTTYVAGGKEMTPGQLLERLGFTNAQMSTPVKDLSGGQRRRLQLLLILLDEPNVLVLDEPSNDLDTDMLAAMEDLLDTWPGTLLVVSHDRYLLERVTDQQYAILDGRFRHVPGGVDEYLRLLDHHRSGNPVATGAPTEATGAAAADGGPGLDGAGLRAAKKELGALERRISKLSGQIEALDRTMAEHDPADYVGLTALGKDKGALEAEVAEVEERWMTLAEAVEG